MSDPKDDQDQTATDGTGTDGTGTSDQLSDGSGPAGHRAQEGGDDDQFQG